MGPNVSLLETQPLHIFLCHSSSDKTPVRELYLRLRSDGFDPWLDEQRLLPGQDWAVEIKRAVAATDVVIVCLSQHSAERRATYKKKLNTPWRWLKNSLRERYFLSLSCWSSVLFLNDFKDGSG